MPPQGRHRRQPPPGDGGRGGQGGRDGVPAAPGQGPSGTSRIRFVHSSNQIPCSSDTSYPPCSSNRGMSKQYPLTVFLESLGLYQAGDSMRQMQEDAFHLASWEIRSKQSDPSPKDNSLIRTNTSTYKGLHYTFAALFHC